MSSPRKTLPLCAALLVGATMAPRPAAAQEVTAIDVRSEIADWTVQFADDFEREQLGNDWQILNGRWKIADGKLVGKGELLCAWRFPGAWQRKVQILFMTV